MGWLTALGVLILLAILPLGVSVRYNADGPLVRLILGPVRLTVVPAKKKSDGKTKKKPKKKQEKAFDMGKLRALHEGGWSVAKIVDEMGVSQQTIYNKLKELKA